MDRIAYVFPGQGSQSVGMGKALAESSPATAAILAEADDALGESISRLAFDGPAEQLDLTANAQPALVAVSIAFLAALRERWAEAGIDTPTPAYVAGHSMGQYSAMVAAGVISLADAVRLVRERGRQMQASGQGRSGAMAAIIGLDDSRIPELLALGEGHGSVTIANRNSPGQIVISGDRAAVEAAVAGVKDLGARRGILLPVSVAAHSSLMAEAAEGMARVLAPIAFAEPTIPLIANADARPITSAEGARGEPRKAGAVRPEPAKAEPPRPEPAVEVRKVERPQPPPPPPPPAPAAVAGPKERRPPESREPEGGTKTLVCTECGTKNLPSEWYCEKCGAELAPY